MPAVPALSVRLLYPFAAVLRCEGVAEEVLLRAAGVPGELFRDPEARISYELGRRFMGAALAHTGHRALGLEAAKHHDAAQFQLFEYFVASSPRIETAIGDLVRHQDVLGDARVLTFERHGEDMLLRYEPPLPPPRVAVEYVLGGLVLSALRSLGGARVPRGMPEVEVVSVCFACPVPPKAREEYARFFGPRVLYETSYNGILISSNLARCSNVRANPGAHEVLGAHLTARPRDAAPARAFADLAREVIADTLANGELSQERVARALHVSRTTLKRKLAAEGTQFRELLSDVRKEAALRALRRSDLSVREIAERAGYEDATAFSKAFKRWTGSSPTQHRIHSRG